MKGLAIVKAPIKQMPIAPTRDPFVDAKQAGKFLALSPEHVLRLARKGLIPCYKVPQLAGGQREYYRFRISEIERALQVKG